MPYQPIRFLYWNTGKEADTQEEVLAYLLETGLVLDVLLLGECFVNLSADFLHKYGFMAVVYHPAETELQAQRIYFRPQPGFQVTHLTADLEDTATDQLVPGVSPAAEYLQRAPRFLTRNVLLSVELNGESTLVSSVHLASRRGGFQDETSQMTVANRYKSFIVQGAGRPLSDFEQRIAVVGDFNMNPFDAPMLEPIGFYAPNNRDAVRVTREAQFVPELMFYNPCWSLLSDIDPLNDKQPRVCGTHYYPGAASKRLHWHLYDQVILSESLADRLVARELRIATFPPLLDYVKSRKGEVSYSDHLPICFTLNL